MARSEKGPPAKKRKGGGIRQRIAAAEAVEAARTISNASSRGQSKLAKFLIESWAKGELSPQKVQHIAELAMCDLSQMGNVQFKTLEKLAALGHHGAAPQNCHRDLLALAKPYSSLPQQSLHCIHFKKKASSMQGIFLPHEIFASLFHDYQESWREVILPHPEKLKQFWEVAKNYPCMEDHPLDASQLQWAIPLSLHGDGVPTSGAGKVSCKMLQISHGALFLEKDPQLSCSNIFGVLLILWEVNEHWMTVSPFLLGASLACSMEHGLLKTTWASHLLPEHWEQLGLDASLPVATEASFLVFWVT